MRVLVTGSASGIGRATVALLRARDVEVLELDVAGGEDTIRCDLGRAAEIESVARGLTGADARLDGVAHVAGLPGTHPAGRVFAVNYLGPRLLARSLEPILNPGASVVFVSSVASSRCAWLDADLAALAAVTWDDALATIDARALSGGETYDLSKRMLAFALPTLTARGVTDRIRVNLVSPGPVETGILPDFRATMGGNRLDAAARMTGRHGRSDEIAHAISFLLSPESSWINGIDLRADGGLFALRAANG